MCIKSKTCWRFTNPLPNKNMCTQYCTRNIPMLQGGPIDLFHEGEVEKTSIDDELRIDPERSPFGDSSDQADMFENKTYEAASLSEIQKQLTSVTQQPSDKYSKMLNADLQALCKERGLTIGGNKNTLVRRLVADDNKKLNINLEPTE